MATCDELNEHFEGIPIGTMLTSMLQPKLSWSPDEGAYVFGELSSLLEDVYSSSSTVDSFRETVTYFNTLTVPREAEGLRLAMTAAPHRNNLVGYDKTMNEHLWSQIPTSSYPPMLESPGLGNGQGRLVFVILNPPDPHNPESAEAFAKLCDSEEIHTITTYIGWDFQNQNGEKKFLGLESVRNIDIQAGDKIEVYYISFDALECLNEFYTC